MFTKFSFFSVPQLLIMWHDKNFKKNIFYILWKNNVSQKKEPSFK